MFKFISLLASIKLLLTIMFSSFRSLCTISTKKINNKSNEMDNEKIIRVDTNRTWPVNIHCWKRRFVLAVHWRDWCWSWNSNPLATWCGELTHLKRPWCWERLRAGGEGDDRGWDGWMASPTQWTWVWVDSGSWWWTGRPGILWFMGSQRVGHDWATKLNCWKKSKEVQV